MIKKKKQGPILASQEVGYTGKEKGYWGAVLSNE